MFCVLILSLIHMHFILITGATGSGKTTVTEKFTHDAFIIHTDFLQRKASLRALPYLQSTHEHGIRALVRHHEHLDLPTLLADCLAPRQQAMRSAKVIMAEGVILSRKWFADALISAVQNILTDPTWQIHRYFLSPPAELMFAQIQARARHKAARRQEATVFPDVPSVRKQRDHHYATLGQGQDAALWHIHGSSDALCHTLQRLLSSPASTSASSNPGSKRTERKHPRD